MNVEVDPEEETIGRTVPIMANYTLSDASMFWQISPWGDGTFFFTNAANGTAWHLTRKGDGLMAMNSNITVPQNGQRFQFKQLGSINNERYSTVTVCILAAGVGLMDG
jgi:hypothetical protein